MSNHRKCCCCNCGCVSPGIVCDDCECLGNNCTPASFGVVFSGITACSCKLVSFGQYFKFNSTPTLDLTFCLAHQGGCLWRHTASPPAWAVPITYFVNDTCTTPDLTGVVETERVDFGVGGGLLSLTWQIDVRLNTGALVTHTLFRDTISPKPANWCLDVAGVTFNTPDGACAGSGTDVGTGGAGTVERCCA